MHGVQFVVVILGTDQVLPLPPLQTPVFMLQLVLVDFADLSHLIN